MNLRIVNPLDYAEWDDLLLKTPGHSFFHTAAWAKSLSESYAYKVTYFTLMESDRFIALIPVMDIRSILTGRRGVSLPFTDYCEPLVTDNVKFQGLFDSIVQHGTQQRWAYFEIRGGENHLSSAMPYTTFLGHTLELSPDEEALKSNLRDSTRRNIRKAVHEGRGVIGR